MKYNFKKWFSRNSSQAFYHHQSHILSLWRGFPRQIIFTSTSIFDLICDIVTENFIPRYSI